MAVNASSRARVSVDGKFFRVGPEKFYAKGVAYGPFPPNDQGGQFGSPARVAADFTLLRALGANLLRVYETPPRWFLDLAATHDLRLLIDVAWDKQSCFLDTIETRQSVRRTVQAAAHACCRHPAVFALSVVNELPADIVRWSGARRIEEFLDQLVATVKEVDAECLCTFGNYPPTEFLRPRETDFVCFNVYLHQPKALKNYLARLQMLADTKPLVLGEFGLDSGREGESRQAELLAGGVAAAFRGGLAGAVVYSFTDEWFKDGRLVPDWHFGLTTHAREPKPAFGAVQAQFRTLPAAPPAEWPMVSVVVACHNGSRTLRLCLSALARLRYPKYEVIVVDDGSTDDSGVIAAAFPDFRYLRQEHLGLSVARNTGIAAARGEVIAFTDADCRPDEDWLDYLVSDLVSGEFVGVGGPNLLPPDDSWVAAVVLVSPGGPAHVMLNDRVAEHIPGCNMAFWKWALLEIGCFDPVFRRAGDDVDVCWRLQQRGHQLGFNAAAFVWHYRRSAVRDYVRQQQGYGEAEALLQRKHPEYFNPLGGSVWRGRIYAPAHASLVVGRPMIYHGPFASGLFQSLYTPTAPLTLMLLTSLEYHVVVTLPLLVVGAMFRWLLPVGVASLCVSLGMCVAAAAQAELPQRRRRLWSRPLVALLFALQPVVRGWARYRGRVLLRRKPLAADESLESLSRQQHHQHPRELRYWAPPEFPRQRFLAQVIEQLDRQGWPTRPDTGWNNFDLEVHGNRWSRLQLTTVGEYTTDGRQRIRCRLTPAWTFPARVAFWSILGATLLIIGLVERRYPWLWSLLLVLPLLMWRVRRQQEALQRLIGVFLDEVAEGLRLRRETAVESKTLAASARAVPAARASPT